jgi:hypothetical protein
VEAGGNFIDTANDYTGGKSEAHLGKFISSSTERDRFVIATKYSANMRSDDPNSGGNSRKSMVHSVDASLKRLRSEYIDLLWVHMWDSVTPIEEVMRGLRELKWTQSDGAIFLTNLLSLVGFAKSLLCKWRSLITELHQVLKEKAAKLTAQNVKGCATLIKPSDFDWSETKLSCYGRDSGAGIRVIARYEHDLPLPLHGRIRSKLCRRQMIEGLDEACSDKCFGYNFRREEPPSSS